MQAETHCNPCLKEQEAKSEQQPRAQFPWRKIRPFGSEGSWVRKTQDMSANGVSRLDVRRHLFGMETIKNERAPNDDFCGSKEERSTHFRGCSTSHCHGNAMPQTTPKLSRTQQHAFPFCSQTVGQLGFRCLSYALLRAASWAQVSCTRLSSPLDQQVSQGTFTSQL